MFPSVQKKRRHVQKYTWPKHDLTWFLHHTVLCIVDTGGMDISADRCEARERVDNILSRFTFPKKPSKVYIYDVQFPQYVISMICRTPSVKGCRAHQLLHPPREPF